MSTTGHNDSLAMPSREQRVRDYLQVFAVQQTRSEGPHRRTLIGPAPASQAQQQLWLHSQIAAGKPIYNEQVTLHREGDLDVGIFHRALNEIVRRHEAWRSTFTVEDGQIYQIVRPSFELPLRFVDMRSFSAADRDQQAWSMAQEQARMEFDLAAAPPLRALLVQLEDRKYRLHLTLHQIIFDGVSIFNIFLPELVALYNAFGEGLTSSLSELPIQYADYANWERDAVHGTALQAQLEYWRRQLANAPAMLDLPADYAPPTKQTFRGAQITFSLSQETTHRLKELSRQQGVTLFMTLLASYAVLLNRHASQTDLLIGTVISTRRRPEFEGLLGLFLNTVVLRIQVSDNFRFSELLKYVREVTVGALCNSEVPTQKILETLQPSRDASRSPMFQAMFVLEPPVPTPPPGWKVTEMDVATGTSRVDLHLQMDERPDGLAARLIYNMDLFEHATAVRLQEHFVSILQSIIDEPNVPVRKIKLHDRRCSPPNSDQVFPANPFVTFDSQDLQQPICKRFEQQVRRHPHRIAVETRSCSWTYDALNRTANRIARALVAYHGQNHQRVALMFEHDAMAIAALLSVLKAGKAYIPLDPTHPVERTRYALKDSDASVLLTNNANWAAASKVAGHLPLLNVDQLPSNGLDTDLNLSISPTTAAYILYTSGSTGEPKGVVQNHANVLFFIRNYTNALHINSDDRLSLISSYCFDAAVMDIFAALLNGAALYPVDVRQQGITGLSEWIASKRITIYHSTPTVYRYLTRALAPDTKFEHSRLIVLGGEPVEQRDFDAFKAHFPPGSIFVNGFGPTESTLALQYFLGQHSQMARASVPTGYPVEDTEIVLLDDRGDTVDIRGEIGIRSAHVALGYWNRPELTKVAFLPDPDGGRLRTYRTGDLGYALPDGSIDFLGRKDNQVKIRGFRIELGELETAITSHPAVQSAAAACQRCNGENRLFAYVVSKPHQSVDAPELRQYLQDRIPDYMLPSSMTFLPELPLTPSGKIDRLALTLLPQERAAVDPDAVPPRNEVEAELINIWEGLLNRKPIGIRHNFFDCGGHSLLVAKLLASIEYTFNKKMGMSAVFQAPTIEQLAELLTHHAEPLQSRGVVPIQGSGTRPPFFCIRGGPLFRNLASELGPDQPFLGIHLEFSEVERLRVPYDLRDIATAFVERIQEVQPTGPYHLGGLCVNGIIAYEVAQQLLRRGEEIGVVVLFDTQSPAFYLDFLQQRGRAELMSARLRYHIGNLLQCTNWLQFSRDRLAGVQRRASRLIWELAYRLQLRVPKTWAGDMDAIIHPAACRYEPLPFSGPVLLFHSSEHPQGPYWDLQAHWKELVLDLNAHEVPGDHDSMFRRPSVSILAEQLASNLHKRKMRTAVSQ